jgi:hypothetical protein
VDEMPSMVVRALFQNRSTRSSFSEGVLLTN